MYAHVVVVREHVWRTLCSVCATSARVAQPGNFLFVLDVYTGAVTSLFKSLFNGLVRYMYGLVRENAPFDG